MATKSVKVICQYTGTEFEAASSRAKNSPAVAALLADANKRGVYSAVVDALVSAKNDGLTGDAVLSVGQAALKGGLEAASAARAKARAEYAERMAEYTARVRDLQVNGPRRQGTDEWSEGPLTTERDEREVAEKMIAVRTSEE
jgi:hypothetical protein